MASVAARSTSTACRAPRAGPLRSLPYSGRSTRAAEGPASPPLGCEPQSWAGTIQITLSGT
eukprot:10595255-Lingulodinium_polyedra.AAC.1